MASRLCDLTAERERERERESDRQILPTGSHETLGCVHLAQLQLVGLTRCDALLSFLASGKVDPSGIK